MRERANGNKIDTCFGNGANICQVHTAAGFGFRAAFDFFHRKPQLHWIHVIEQNDVRACIGGLRDLFQCVGLDPNLQFRKFFTRARTAAAMAFGFSFCNTAR